MTSIGSITIYAEAYINESKNITQEQTENIMFPEGLSQEDNILQLHRRSLYNKCKKRSMTESQSLKSLNLQFLRESGTRQISQK